MLFLYQDIYQPDLLIFYLPDFSRDKSLPQGIPFCLRLGLRQFVIFHLKVDYAVCCHSHCISCLFDYSVSLRHLLVCTLGKFPHHSQTTLSQHGALNVRSAGLPLLLLLLLLLLEGRVVGVCRCLTSAVVVLCALASGALLPPPLPCPAL